MLVQLFLQSGTHLELMIVGVESNADVYITDVGGSRSQRATWVPYFDDGGFIWRSFYRSGVLNHSTVQAILFLAPLAFNQTLEEAVRVNRLVRYLFYLFGPDLTRFGFRRIA